MNFKSKLNTVVSKNNSLVCVGLDPELAKIPSHLKNHADAIFQFSKAVVDSTHDIVAAYKPNIAFYEAEGIDGLNQLKNTIEYIQAEYPEVPIILDAKRGDIGNTARMYARAAFEYWQADAVTVFPHLGLDALAPFFEYKDKLTIVLFKTSNPDSGQFQNLMVGEEPYYLKVAERLALANIENLGVFAGATYPEEMKKLRKLFLNNIFLTAGIGAQNAIVEHIVKSGIDKNGAGIMFNASRSIIYASGGEDFAEKAREETKKLRDEINRHRNV